MGGQDGRAHSPYSGSNWGGTTSVFEHATKGKERANEGDGNPMKDANDAGLNSPPPTPAVVDERRGVTGGLNALSPAAPTREGEGKCENAGQNPAVLFFKGLAYPWLWVGKQVHVVKQETIDDFYSPTWCCWKKSGV